MSQAKWILFALLTGGDYDEGGVPGCGMETAYGLARCGFGNDLVHAIRTIQSQPVLQKFLSNWRESIKRELSQGFLPHRQPAVANRISDQFPDLRVLQFYLNPLTSNPDTVQKDWLIKQPLLHNLAEFCSERFEWSDEQILKKKFKNGIWEGALLQMLFSVSIQLVSEYVT
ncbi:hypothetical protein HYPSUDRAFT_139674 [Hypholoma sublateritium FD-334 SS-4]|uniref:XPG-I domain-containing protein n=1 Tax=Hypholoma sublateritium (strain FD-334 SS-4) TaxID=945553 RepID=A0A0D2NTP1_HYPSF|nr:hypothetical protein HYPSUDRAFT_139674 [Hypholoma sublateritium FD-334 SS-4]